MVYARPQFVRCALWFVFVSHPRFGERAAKRGNPYLDRLSVGCNIPSLLNTNISVCWPPFARFPQNSIQKG